MLLSMYDYTLALKGAGIEIAYTAEQNHLDRRN